MNTTACLLALHACLFTSPLQAQEIASSDFERDDAGAAPAGWLVPQVVLDNGYRVRVEDGKAAEGKHWCSVSFEGEERPVGFGNVMQSFDAHDLRNAELRFTVSARAAGGARAQPWLRIDLEDGETGFLDNCGDRPVTSKRWEDVEIRAFVPDDAVSVSVGLMLIGEGTAGLDDVRLEVQPLGEDAYELRPPAALDDDQVERLMTLGRAVFAVRRFHPSDALEALEEHGEGVHLLVRGVLDLERVEDDDAFRRTLGRLFAEVAPSVQVASADATYTPHPELARPDERRPRLVRWRHVGLGSEHGGGGAYSSWREREKIKTDAGEPLDAELLEEGWSDPAAAAQLVLTDDLRLWIPTRLWGDAKRALPETDSKHEVPLPPGFRFDADDRTTRLCAVLELATALEFAYPYFDVVETDWDAAFERALRDAAEDADGAELLGTLRTLVAALHDGHGNVYGSRDPANAQLPLAFEWIEDAPVVIAAKGSAAEAGVSPGAALIAVDGRPIAELLGQLAAEISAATPQWLRTIQMQRLVAGPRGQTAALTFETPDGDPLEVQLEYGRPTPGLERPRPEPLAELEPGLWYVDLTRLDTKTLKRALDDLATASGIVFDLRGYPGALSPDDFLPHLSPEPLESPQWWVGQTLGLDEDGHPDTTFARSPGWNLQPAEPLLTENRAFLIDGRCISYAESVLGIIDAYSLGELIGTPTAGTNGNINILQLPGDCRAIFTGMRVLRHDGEAHHGRGIAPTIALAPTRAGTAAGRDELLERALETVSR